MNDKNIEKQLEELRDEVKRLRRTVIYACAAIGGFLLLQFLAPQWLASILEIAYLIGCTLCVIVFLRWVWRIVTRRA